MQTNNRTRKLKKKEETKLSKNKHFLEGIDAIYVFVSMYMKILITLVLLYVINSIQPLGKLQRVLLLGVFLYWICYPLVREYLNPILKQQLELEEEK